MPSQPEESSPLPQDHPWDGWGWLVYFSQEEGNKRLNSGSVTPPALRRPPPLPNSHLFTSESMFGLKCGKSFVTTPEWVCQHHLIWSLASSQTGTTTPTLKTLFMTYPTNELSQILLILELHSPMSAWSRYHQDLPILTEVRSVTRVKQETSTKHPPQPHGHTAQGFHTLCQVSSRNLKKKKKLFSFDIWSGSSKTILCVFQTVPLFLTCSLQGSADSFHGKNQKWRQAFQHGQSFCFTKTMWGSNPPDQSPQGPLGTS